MPKNPSIYTSHTKAKDAFIRDIQQHRNYIRSAFNQYGKMFCDLIGANYDNVEKKITNHDLSKYKEEVEVIGIMAYYYRYPEDNLDIDSTRRKYLLEKAMLNHYHLNSCHPEYWVHYKSGKLTALPMDDDDIVEMILDWIAIGMEPDFDRADVYWAQNRTKKLMAEETIRKVDILIDKLTEEVNNGNEPKPMETSA